jgi:hypothetical protein
MSCIACTVIDAKRYQIWKKLEEALRLMRLSSLRDDVSDTY